MADDSIIENGGSIEPVNLREALEERYLAYALSTIMHRALPDVRDGLKPVHRRLVYAMSELKLNPEGGFKKCAKIVGEVMGQYHPHGDQAIYDALARLAQDFAVRYPLINGQGNFGNIDGDNPAAMRYTEAKMTAVASALLDGINEDTVDFRETYDGEDSEPVVLPSNFPNLLANGSTGIAVGMATSIPPHNIDELCSALLHLIKFPNATTQKLVDFIPGPDLPTGGIIVEGREAIVQTYKTGRGSFRVRACWEVEQTGRGGYQVVVTEIPYQVQKSRLIEKIAELMMAKRLPLVGDILDESAEDVRIVIEPKSRTVDPLVLMESLFKLTELENRLSLNMNVLSAGQIPNVLSLHGVLTQWLAHRKEVLIRRSEFRRKKIEHRLEVLDGYLIAFLNLDEVIKIIREEDHAKTIMMERFKLTDVQAEAVLNMRLRALRKLEEIAIREEHSKLTVELGEIMTLLGSEELQWKRISDQIRETRANFGAKTDIGKRRTQFADAPTIEVDLDQVMIEKEPITLILSDKGWIRALRGHQDDLGKVQFKQGDRLKVAVKAQTTDKIVLYATNGKFFTLAADKLPGGRGHGEPVRLMLDLEESADIITVFVHQPDRKLLVASTAGNGFVVAEKDIVAMTKKGKQVLNVSGGDEAIVVAPAHGDTVAVIGENRKMLVFPLSEVNEMTRGRGVRLQRYKDGGVSDVKVFNNADGLTWLDAAGRVFKADDLMEWRGARAQAGRMAPKGFPRNNKFGSVL